MLLAKEIPGGVDFLIIDPIVVVIGAKLDNSNNAGHREKLQPLVDFATELRGPRGNTLHKRNHR